MSDLSAATDEELAQELTRRGDRDVRENPHFYGMVVDYLEQYQGEFEFLVSCKMRLQANIDLTVGMVRGVLNCMRADPRVGVMPEPVPMPEFPDDLVPQVVDLGDRTPAPFRQSRKPKKGKCTRTDYHGHEWADWQTLEYCPGLYKYFRNEGKYSYRMAATSEYGLCVGRSASTTRVHAISEIEIEWYPNIHHSGWARQPDVICKTVCTQPWSLRNPIILDRQIMRKVNFDGDRILQFCGRCMPNG